MTVLFSEALGLSFKRDVCMGTFNTKLQTSTGVSLNRAPVSLNITDSKVVSSQ